jgi:O-antigen ligase/tetratricopeptide (TPR) repeat protein
MTRNILRYIALTGLFIIPFVPFLVSGSLFFPFITTKGYAFRIIVEVIFAAWLILAALDPVYRPKKTWTTYALCIFILIIGIADIFGAAPLKSFWSNSERMEGFVSLLHLGMFYLVARGMLTQIEWKRLWNTSLAASFLMAIYCALQLLGTFEIHQGGARVDGTLGNAAYLAVYLLFHIFIALLFMAKEKRGATRWIYGLLALVLTVVLYYTATRGAILGLLGGLLVAALLGIKQKENGRQRKLSIAYVGVFLVVILGFLAVKNTSFVRSSPVLDRFASISSNELKTEGRSFVWPMAIQGIKEHPILGWGQENFNYVFNEHYSPAMFRIEPWFDRAHNIFLDWAIAGGLLGLVSYLSLYIVLLYYVWKKDSAFTSSDRALITGLVAAYFFHNLFVFDHLISYILFFMLLAFVDSRVSAPHVFEKFTVSEKTIVTIGGPVILIGLVVTLYFVNVKPITANMELISALQIAQTGDLKGAIAGYENAYGKARLGNPEIVEQIASNAPTVLGSTNLATDEKNTFYAFATHAVETQAAELEQDARYQLLAGTFLENTGQFDQALVYLEKARVLTPGKQLVYLEIAGVYINKGDYAKGLASLKFAYELDTNDIDAESAYLVGAIYAKDRTAEATLRADLLKKSPASLVDDRVTSAYIAAGRMSEVVAILEAKLESNASDPQAYINLAAAYLKMGDKAGAIATLERLSGALPQYKATVDGYISQIKSGALK